MKKTEQAENQSTGSSLTLKLSVPHSVLVYLLLCLLIWFEVMLIAGGAPGWLTVLFGLGCFCLGLLLGGPSK